MLYDGSKSGVKRLELFESEIKFKKQNPVKIIPLVDCVRIVTCQRHKTTFTFEVSLREVCIRTVSHCFAHRDRIRALGIRAGGGGGGGGAPR